MPTAGMVWEAKVMNAEGLAFRNNTFTHSITHFSISLFPRPNKVASQIYCTLKPEKVALLTSRTELEWLRILQ